MLGGHMRKQRYTPYFFDIKYEKRTYKHIGKDYGDRKTADKGLIRNFLRWNRKHIYNRKELKYKFCDTYEDWKLYLLDRKFCNNYDKQNMIKFLNKQKRSCGKIFESVKTIIIPLYITIYSGAIALMDKFWSETEALESMPRKSMSVYLILLLLFIIGVSFYWIVKNKDDISFYKDYMDCMEKNEDLF